MQQTDGTIMVARVGVTVLRLHEIRKDVAPPPAGIAGGCPIIEIARLAADVDHGVDRARSTEDLAARPVARPTTRPWIGFGQEHPVDSPVIEGAAVSDRRTDPEAAVAPSRLEDENPVAAVLRESVGE